MENIKDELLKLVDENPCSFSSVIARKRPDILEYLKTKYASCGPRPIAEYVYMETHDMASPPVCGCGNPVKFAGFRLGYRKFCSIGCMNRSGEHIEKNRRAVERDPDFWKKRDAATKTTKAARYGDERYSNAEKARETRISKNGGAYHPADFAEKCRATKLERYGDGNYVNPEKARSTRGAKTAVDSGYIERIAERVRKTKLFRYGDPSFVNPVKARRTDEANHGGEAHTKTREFKQRVSSARRAAVYKKLVLGPEKEPLFSFEEYEEAARANSGLKFRCRRCGGEFEIPHHVGNHFPYLYRKCPVCFPPSTRSKSDEEKELAGFLKRFGFAVYENSRGIVPPYELDAYLPEKKLAVEFDGLFWHSEANKPNKFYHLAKTEACEKAGISLVHVFENEWRSKRAIVESRLKNLLGVYDRTVYARKCEVKDVSPADSREFQEKCHMQGPVNAAVRLGLFYDGEMVSLMTFGRCRFSKKYEWELLRFCNRLGYHVPGGAGRLLRAFERKYRPKSLVSYADRRWSRGGLYRALGFSLSHESPPDYWYWKGAEFAGRVKYQKHRLPKLLEKFDPAMTEVENMYMNGYNRIFDCGNFVFEKTY